MFRLFKVSASGYYDYLKRDVSPRALSNEKLDVQIKRLFKAHKHRYGYRRIHDDLLELGFAVSAERVRRRMQSLRLKARLTRAFKRTTDSKHKLPVAPNLLQRAFKQNKPNQAWVTDITYIRVKQSWLYLCSVLDLYSKRIVGWSMSSQITASMACEALTMALKNRKYPQGVIVHSDRGSQYCSQSFQTLVKQNNLKSSMSGKGNCYDNAVAESFFKTLKVEEIYCQRYETVEQAKCSIFYYIESYYNRKRKHSSLDYRSPVDFENQLLKTATNCP